MLHPFSSLTIQGKNKIKQKQATQYFTLRIDLFHLTEAFCITHHWGIQKQHVLLMRTIACKFLNLKYSREIGNDIYSLTYTHFGLLMKDQKKPECNTALSFVFNCSERLILHRKTASRVGVFPVIAVVTWEEICGLPKAGGPLALLSNSYSAAVHQGEGMLFPRTVLLTEQVHSGLRLISSHIPVNTQPSFPFGMFSFRLAFLRKENVISFGRESFFQQNG